MLAGQINWAIVFYVLLMAAVLVVLHHFGGISFNKLFAGISKEIRLLLRHGPFDRGKINIITLMSITIVIVFYLFVEPVQKFIELMHEVHGAGEGGPAPAYVFLTCVFVLVIFGYLSVLASDRR
jgi:hypothetical protein